jgi:hypothetical protein
VPVALCLIVTLAQAQCAISTPEQVDRLFTFIASLVVKEEGEDAKYVACITCPALSMR